MANFARSVISDTGRLSIWVQQNHTRHEGCFCAATHAPCQFCTDTFECDRCGHIYYSDECVSTKLGLECHGCVIENYPEAFNNL